MWIFSILIYLITFLRKDFEIVSKKITFNILFIMWKYEYQINLQNNNNQTQINLLNKF